MNNFEFLGIFFKLTFLSSDNEKYREKFPKVYSSAAKSVKNCCSVKTLKKRLPIVEWLPRYNKETFFYDAIAGLTVSLTLIPQGIAFALIADLPPHYGLYSAFMGSFVYTIFGSCKDVTVGKRNFSKFSLSMRVSRLFFINRPDCHHGANDLLTGS